MWYRSLNTFQCSPDRTLPILWSPGTYFLSVMSRRYSISRWVKFKVIAKEGVVLNLLRFLL